jgi:copper chaperone CopZ
MVKIVFHVKDMHCSSCAMMIESIEDDLPGVLQVKASYQKARMEIEYDETKVSEAQIIAAVKEKGYAVIPLGHEVYL